MEQIAYIVKHNDLNIRMQSRSGGIFTALSDVILAKQGVVYGCAINDNHLAEHRRATTKAERDSFRGSKYVQSNMNDCYQNAKSDLANGETVLFSGTGCQIAGLKAGMQGSHTDNLFTVDIVCHGVPSPMLWDSFLKWMEQRYEGPTESVNFRDKKYGWMSHFETVVIKKKQRVADYYRAMFYKHYSLRPSCYQCPYCNLERSSDITIADAWGIDRNHTDFNDDRGCSLVIINTQKGKDLFELAYQDIEAREVNLQEFMQPNLRAPSFRPDNRELFWNDFYEKGFDFVSRKYGQNTKKGKLMSMVKRILGRTRTTKYAKKFFKI